MSKIIGATRAVLTPGQWLLGRAGVAAGPIVPGVAVLDGRAPLAEGPEGITVRLWLGGEGTPDHRDLDPAAVVLPAPGAPPADLAAVRAAALEEVARAAAARDAVTLDGVRYGIGLDSQANWAALFEAVRCAAALGLPAPWPVAFAARDGVVVELDSEAEARGLYLRLFAAGDELRESAMVASAKIDTAASVSDILASLSDYLEAP